MTDEEASVPYEMVRVVAERFLRAMYGPRCPDYQEECECCERWKALDRLVDNPFAKRAKIKGERPKKESYDILAITDAKKVESRLSYESKKDEKPKSKHKPVKKEVKEKPKKAKKKTVKKTKIKEPKKPKKGTIRVIVRDDD